MYVWPTFEHAELPLEWKVLSENDEVDENIFIAFIMFNYYVFFFFLMQHLSTVNRFC